MDRRLRSGVVWLGLGALLTVAVLRGTDLWWRRQQLLRVAEQRAANLALILAEYLREVFAAADASLRQLAIHGQRVGGPTSPPSSWGPILASARSGLTGIGSLTVTDVEGVIRHSTIPAIVGQSRRSEYVFQRLLADPRDVLVADTPFRAVSGSRRILIPLGRRLTGADGRFDGTVVATILPDELRGFFQKVDVGRTGTVWVFHPDGLVLFREPSAANPIGESARGNPLFEAARSAAYVGTVRTTLAAGGPMLLSAFQRLEEPRLVVGVSLGAPEVLAEWWREVGISAAVLAGVGLILAGGLILLFRQMDALAEAEQALARARRLESLGHLTGGVAHDFNNLLTVILGNVARLRRRPEAVPPVDEIERAADRAADLTRRLLAFARRQPLKPQVVDVNDLVQSLHPMLTRVLGEDVTLKLALAPSLAPTRLDVVQAENALINVCANARDAMPGGGLLVVETSMAVLDEGYARHTPDVVPGRYVMISVSDTGSGIPPEHMAHLFEPFFTTKALGKGTGLGLSTVYGFVKQSGGHLKAYSEVGHGTTMKMYFPEAPGTVVAASPVPEKAEDRGRGEVILLVEDEKAVRELAEEMLLGLGYKVLTAADGPAALELAGEQSRLDLVLTDVVLPRGMTGRQVAEAVQHDRPGVRILFASGYSEDIVSYRGQVASGLRLLSKPYSLRDLAQAVRSALDDGAPHAGADAASPKEPRESPGS